MKPNLVARTCKLLKWVCNYRKLHNKTQQLPMAIFPLAPDQTIAQMWSNGARGPVGLYSTRTHNIHACYDCRKTAYCIKLYRSLSFWFQSATRPIITFTRANQATKWSCSGPCCKYSVTINKCARPGGRYDMRPSRIIITDCILTQFHIFVYIYLVTADSLN